MLRTVIRNLLVESIENEKYWGRGGAGVLFVCKEDQTILLLHRADWVAQGGTWGVPGGSVTEDQWFTLPINKPLLNDDPAFFDGAQREVSEECGSLPPNFSTKNVYDETLFEDRGFKYKTFVYNIAEEDKKNWELASHDGETQDFKWVPIKQLNQFPLHFGVIYTLQNAVV